MSIKSIGVIGVGGVGGYFGAKLCHLQKNGSGCAVSFVARGAHLRAIQETGLLVSSESDGDLVCQPAVATDDFRRLPPMDLCLLCVKEFDLPDALSQLGPIVGDKTVLLPLLNGVDVYARVRTVIKKGIVLPACVYVGTHIERPGKVVQKGGACKILFGPDPAHPEFVPHEISDLFDQSGIKSEWTPSVQVEIWKKFIFICAFGLVSAAHDKTLGEVLDDEDLRNETETVIDEVVSVAKAAGVPLPSDIANVSLLKARTFPYEARTSFQRDFDRADRKDERDLFAGSMIRMGDELGVHVPVIGRIAKTLAKRKPLV